MNKITKGDCLAVLKDLEENSVDSIVTDPPYELGFMGKSWDNTGIANNKEMWTECLRVLKPGGHLLAFSGTRTYHRMASAIEDAGFEVRDMIEWVYSTGFPKSLNLNKALQKKCTCGNMEVYDNERTKQNTEHDLRPVSESHLSQKINSTKEQGEVLQSGLSEQSVSPQQYKSTENLRGEEPLLEGGNNNEKTERKLQGSDLPEMSEGISINGEERRVHNATQVSDGSTSKQTTDENGSGASHRPQSEQQQNRKHCAFCEQLGTQETRRLYEETYGVGSALKPAHEPICLARKPLSEKTLVDNFIKYGTGGINIDESRVGANEELGRNNNARTSGTSYVVQKETMRIDNSNGKRFPANLIHDNSEEVRECFPETNASKSANRGLQHSGRHGGLADIGGNIKDGTDTVRGHDDNGGNASRFFKSIIYQAKASKSERNKGCEGLEERKISGMPDITIKIYADKEQREISANLFSTHLTKTDKEIAENYGFSPALIRMWRTGDRIPNKETYYKLKSEFSIPNDLDCIYEIEQRERTSIIDSPTRKSANNHPTVKPIALMEYLIKMVTPKGGTVLDPFAGSGSTLVAAKQNGYQYIGIEMTEEYIPIIEARLSKFENKLF